MSSSLFAAIVAVLLPWQFIAPSTNSVPAEREKLHLSQLPLVMRNVSKSKLENRNGLWKLGRKREAFAAFRISISRGRGAWRPTFWLQRPISSLR